MSEVFSPLNLLGGGLVTKEFASKRHASNTLEKMKFHFLNEELTDVVLIAGKRRIPAHRLVLSAGSEYFAAMFRNDLKEASQNEIVMHTVDGDALHALIKYCYTGKIKFERDTVEALLVTACLLQLNEVVEACCAFLEEQLDPSNCIGIKHFADSLGCTSLNEAAQNYTINHFAEVIQNQEFLKLSEEDVAELLASDSLRVPSEEVVFKGLMSWIEYDLSSRRKLLNRLLTHIRFPLLSPSFIVDHIESNPLFRELPEYPDLIVESYKYRLLPGRRSTLKPQRTCPRNYSNKILLLGGFDDGVFVESAESYNPRVQKWTREGNISLRAPVDSGIAEFEGKLYVCGGFRSGNALGAVQCFNIKTKTLEALPSMLTLRQCLGVGVLSGLLYAVGGQNNSGILNTVERFNPVTNMWSDVAPMCTKRSKVGVTVLNGKLYAVGGFHYRGSYSTKEILTSVECYDPSTGRWTSCQSMRTARMEPGVGVLNGLLYVVGGSYSVGTYSNSVERYNPQTDSWTSLAPMPCAREGVGVFVMGEKLFAVGGNGTEGVMNVVEAYNPHNNKWMKVTPLNDYRTKPVAIVTQ